MYTNTDNLMNKRHELEAAISEYTPHIVCITEFAPKNTATPIQESELQITGYDLFSNIENCKRGVLIYTISSLKASPSTVTDMYNFEEHCWCEIKLRDNDRLLVGCIYRSPNSDSINNEKILNDLNNTATLKYSHLLICGDFNHPGINWDGDERGGDAAARAFVEGMRDTFLHQHIISPTHFHASHRANILDLVFTNEEGMINNIKHEAPLGKSHHQTLIFNLNCYAPREGANKTSYLYEKADYDNMREYMSATDWNIMLENQSCDDAWKLFLEKFNVAMDKHIPKRTNKNKRKKPLWMNPAAIAKLKKKHKAFRRYMQTQEGSDYNEYAKARNQAKWECRKAVRDFEQKIASQSKNNPKAFFSYAKSKLKSKSGIADLNYNGETATTSKDKATMLNDFFSSVFTKEDISNLPSFDERKYNNPLKQIEITTETVKKKLHQLNPSKASGPDNLNPRVLRELANEIATPVAIIMNKALEEGVPNDWKTAKVSPIFKKGVKTNPGNYRPVSLTSILCKVQESIIRDHIIQHLVENNLLSDSQHGFINGRSCLTNLLEVLDKWTKILENEGSVDTVYLDFAKAFDTVPHERLLVKLSAYGIKGDVLKWIKSFLGNRKQQVVVNGEESEWRSVLSGVPQGSVLGPVLFVIFVNDIPEVVKSMVYLFADDTKLFARAPDDCSAIQDDLNNLQTWADTWQLRFNANKCKVMHIGKHKEGEYTMTSSGGTVVLDTVEVEKDLGVNIDNNLNFDHHIDSQVKKANKLLGMIRRTYTTLDTYSLPLLYNAIIRPHLEYCIPVWSPRWKKDQESIERVQRRATKLIPELKTLEYVDRLKALKLPSLYYRRARGDMIECYKYLHGIYNVSSDLLQRDVESRTRGHSMKLKKGKAKGAARYNFFSFRCVNAWNSLSENVVSAETLNQFKNKLDDYWQDFHYATDSDWYKNPKCKQTS